MVILEAVLFLPITWFPNDTVEGVAVTAATPVPLKPAVCGLLLALSVTVSVAEAGPRAVGVKVIEIVQLAPAASFDGLTGQVVLKL